VACKQTAACNAPKCGHSSTRTRIVPCKNAATPAPAHEQCHAKSLVPCKSKQPAKKMWPPGIEPGSSGPKPHCTSRLNYGCFSYGMHP
jgi:hypothetical protein